MKCRVHQNCRLVKSTKQLGDDPSRLVYWLLAGDDTVAHTAMWQTGRWPWLGPPNAPAGAAGPSEPAASS
eukprot:8720270-Lingulodinium_polyedra.AAC.1